MTIADIILSLNFQSLNEREQNEGLSTMFFTTSDIHRKVNPHTNIWLKQTAFMFSIVCRIFLKLKVFDFCFCLFVKEQQLMD